MTPVQLDDLVELYQNWQKIFVYIRIEASQSMCFSNVEIHNKILKQLYSIVKADYYTQLSQITSDWLRV